MQTTDDLLGHLHGVTGPEVTPRAPPSQIDAWLIAVVVFAGLSVVVIWRWRRPARPNRPVVEAQQELTRLSRDPSLDDLHRLDRLIRRYLSRTRSVAAETLAVQELRLALHADANPWVTLLQDNDCWRFAGELPSHSEWTERLRQAATLLQAEAGNPDGR